MVNQQLMDYINQARNSGATDQDVEKRLIESGWNQEDINLALGKTANTDKPEGNRTPMMDSGSPVLYDLGLGKEANSKQEMPQMQAIPAIPQAGQAEMHQDKKGSPRLGIIIGALVLLIALAAVYLYMNLQQRTISPEVSGVSTKKNINKGTENSLSGVADNKLRNGVYENSEAGFAVKPPSGWMTDSSGAFGTLVAFTNPVYDLEGDNKYTANMNVVAENTSQTLAEYIEASKVSLARNFDNHYLVSESQARSGLPGMILESTYDQGVFKIHNMQLVVLSGGKAYVVTTAAVESSWEKYRPVFAEVLNSFTLM